MNSEILQIAVQNNAHWCAAVAKSHGLDSEWFDDVWLCRSAMPPFYPNLITLQPTTPNINHWLDQLIDLPAEWGVKDSYANLDLNKRGFQQAFVATWYWRGTTTVPTIPRGAQPVTVVTDERKLDMWERAWCGEQTLHGSVFVSELLRNPVVRIVGRSGAGGKVPFDAGLSMNDNGGVIGLSNLFGPADGVLACIDAASGLYPQRTMVGYGDAEELAMLSAVGFSPLADLRVWMYR